MKYRPVYEVNEDALPDDDYFLLFMVSLMPLILRYKLIIPHCPHHATRLSHISSNVYSYSYREHLRRICAENVITPTESTGGCIRKQHPMYPILLSSFHPGSYSYFVHAQHAAILRLRCAPSKRCLFNRKFCHDNRTTSRLHSRLQWTIESVSSRNSVFISCSTAQGKSYCPPPAKHEEQFH